jgi:hypothetical protein
MIGYNQFEAGDMVRNSNLQIDKTIGVLITRCNFHNNYWKVLCEGDIVTWFESNLVKINDQRTNART